MEAGNINWANFRKRIVIDTPLSEVYAAWATQAKLEKWFLEKA